MKKIQISISKKLELVTVKLNKLNASEVNLFIKGIETYFDESLSYEQQQRLYGIRTDLIEHTQLNCKFWQDDWDYYIVCKRLNKDMLLALSRALKCGIKSWDRQYKGYKEIEQESFCKEFQKEVEGIIK